MKKLFSVIFVLVILSGAASANIVYYDGFEYSDSPTNHGWNIFPTESGVYATNETSTFGNQSLKLYINYPNSGGRHIEQVFDNLFWDRISVDFYDSMISNTNWDSGVYVWLGGTDTTLIRWYNSSNYAYMYSGGGNLVSNVQRSLGWHNFEWINSNGFIDLYIDSILIANDILKALPITGIRLYTGDDYPSYAYFDEVTIYSNAVPEPTTMLLLGSGLIGLTGARRRLKNNPFP